MALVSKGYTNPPPSAIHNNRRVRQVINYETGNLHTDIFAFDRLRSVKIRTYNHNCFRHGHERKPTTRHG